MHKISKAQAVQLVLNAFGYEGKDVWDTEASLAAIHTLSVNQDTLLLPFGCKLYVQRDGKCYVGGYAHDGMDVAMLLETLN